MKRAMAQCPKRAGQLKVPMIRPLSFKVENMLQTMEAPRWCATLFAYQWAGMSMSIIVVKNMVPTSNTSQHACCHILNDQKILSLIICTGGGLVRLCVLKLIQQCEFRGLFAGFKGNTSTFIFFVDCCVYPCLQILTPEMIRQTLQNGKLRAWILYVDLIIWPSLHSSDAMCAGAFFVVSFWLVLLRSHKFYSTRAWAFRTEWKSILLHFTNVPSS